MPARRSWAACSNGASSASARSVQWADSPVRPSGRAAPAMARASTSDSSHVVAGDDRRPAQPGHPGRARQRAARIEQPAAADAGALRWPSSASRSGLVEVTTTGPGRGQHVRDRHPGRLARAGRTEDEQRLLRRRPGPARPTVVPR